MPQQNYTVVLRPLVMLLALIAWLAIFALLGRLVKGPEGRFRIVALGPFGLGFSLIMGWLIQLLVFGPVGYIAAQRAAVEHVWLTWVMFVGVVLLCAGLALGAWARVSGKSLLGALLRPPANVGDRWLRPRVFLALYALGWGVGALACGLPVVLGYV